VAGAAEGELLVTSEPLSFWGGYDHTTGEIIDRRHPLAGKKAAGRILAVPSSKGSSTTTAVLLEAIKEGTAPAAILTVGGDSFFALASIVADELFHKAIPILALEPADFFALATGQYAIIEDGGAITIQT
jgi:predicted aconitase with swiveling domain